MATNTSSPLILYAPGIHTGGGLTLLKSILDKWPREIKLIAFIDARASEHLSKNDNAEIFWITQSIISRLTAELKLSFIANESSTIFCLHGIAPLLLRKSIIIVFLQNLLLITSKVPAGYKLKTRIRLTIERLFFWLLRRRVVEYIVQTKSMERTLIAWGLNIGHINPKIKVFPFIDFTKQPPVNHTPIKKWDFIYIADGEAHKNHINLFEAWKILAQDGIFPSLALTLGARDSDLICKLEELINTTGVKIKNIGKIPYTEVLNLYKTSKALIYPSILESFGLPLIEASNESLPILASELDFVRDVCIPDQTFDPTSPTSIARAVKRFLAIPESITTQNSTQDIIEYLNNPTNFINKEN